MIHNQRLSRLSWITQSRPYNNKWWSTSEIGLNWKLTTKLRPLAIKMTLETALVLPPQGRTHWPDALLELHDEPGPCTGSYPAALANDWNKVIVYPFGATPFIWTDFEQVMGKQDKFTYIISVVVYFERILEMRQLSSRRKKKKMTDGNNSITLSLWQ